MTSSIQERDNQNGKPQIFSWTLGALGTDSIFSLDLGQHYDIGLIRIYCQNPGGHILLDYSLWACSNSDYTACGTAKFQYNGVQAPSGIIDIEPPSNGIWNAQWIHIVMPGTSSNAAYGIRIGEIEVYPWRPVLGGVTGDPQFSGFLNQQYQVHGTPGHIYDIITTPNMQVNAEFVFLDHGVCPKFEKDETLCWTHPGTYLGSIGLTMALKRHHQDGENGTVVRVLIQSGPADKGLTVFVDDV